MVDLNTGNKKYPPNNRTFLKPNPSSLRSYSPNGESYSKLPNPVTDNIVVNNISNVEFDYIHLPEENDKV